MIFSYAVAKLKSSDICEVCRLSQFISLSPILIDYVRACKNLAWLEDVVRQFCVSNYRCVLGNRCGIRSLIKIKYILKKEKKSGGGGGGEEEEEEETKLKLS